MASSRTTHLTAKEAKAQRRWFIVDADGVVLGRLATRVASALRGKTNPAFSPHQDTGDFVVVINAAKVKFTGKKLEGKIYYRHTGFPGGVRERTASEWMARAPDRVVRNAVQGMLPKNRLGRRLATKLKVYSGTDHPHVAQQPAPLP
jgi:large subunit ribosomal protein L13